MSIERVTTVTLRAMKARRERISMLTAYDAVAARLLDGAAIEVILVGDSLAMTALGHPTTLPVTVEEMLHHTRAVTRAVRRALVVGDLPFLSYQCGRDEAVRNAGRFLKEAGAGAVKLEGGRPVAALVADLVEAGIPVMGHIGLTPQHVHRLGGFRIQGKTAAAAEGLLADARALQEAGAFALVLEGMPWQVARRITAALEIPTIGIGAGPHCDGQVLVTTDLLGLTPHPPRFVKRYADLTGTLAEAFGRYRDEVRAGAFPGPEHVYTLPETEEARLEAEESAAVRASAGR